MSGFEEMLRNVLLEMLRRRALVVLHPETGKPFSELDVVEECRDGGRFVISLVPADSQNEMLRNVLFEMLRRRALVVLHPETGGLFSEQDVAQMCHAGGRFIVSQVPAGCRDHVKHMQRMVRVVARGVFTAEELPDLLEPPLLLLTPVMAADWASAIRESLSHLEKLNASESTLLIDCRKTEAVQRIRALAEAPLAQCGTDRTRRGAVVWLAMNTPASVA